MIQEYWYWPLLLIGAVGAVWDIGWRKLPNLLCAALAIAGVAAVIFSQGAGLLPSALGHAAIALVVGMVLFKFGAIGGGDAKFYAAAACGLPLGLALPMLGWTSLSGLLLLIGMSLTRIAMRRPATLKGWSLPYGVAIFGGLAMTIITTPGAVRAVDFL